MITLASSAVQMQVQALKRATVAEKLVADGLKSESLRSEVRVGCFVWGVFQPASPACS